VDPDAARALAVIVSAVVGLAVGSFLNVVIHRLPRGESLLHPASHCPTCGSPLGALENVPVFSWVLLRAQCRHCASPISARYPVVELLTATAFAGLAAAVPTLAPLAPLDMVAGATIAVGAIDLDGCDPPAVLGWVAITGSAALALVAVAADSPGRISWAAIGGAACLGARAIPTLRVARTEGRSVPPRTICAAWGWSAGWCALDGGLSVVVALVVLELIGRAGRTRTAVAGSVALATVLVGCAVVGPRVG
jgi:leader peptidase (prepilin peptidase)/N-methyltransferase